MLVLFETRFLIIIKIKWLNKLSSTEFNVHIILKLWPHSSKVYSFYPLECLWNVVSTRLKKS